MSEKARTRKGKKKKYKKQVKITKTQRVIISIVGFSSPLLLLVPALFYKIVCAEYLLHNKPEIFFVMFQRLPTSLSYLWLLIPIIVTIIYCYNLTETQFVFKKDWKGLLTIFLIVFVFLGVWLRLDNTYRYDFTEHGIYKYSGSSLIKEYSWSDISRANIYVSYYFDSPTRSLFRKKIYYYPSYYIILNDNNHLDILDGYSRNTWVSAVKIDRILRQENIPVSRDKWNAEKVEEYSSNQSLRYLFSN